MLVENPPKWLFRSKNFFRQKCPFFCIWLSIYLPNNALLFFFASLLFVFEKIEAKISKSRWMVCNFTGLKGHISGLWLVDFDPFSLFLFSRFLNNVFENTVCCLHSVYSWNILFWTLIAWVYKVFSFQSCCCFYLNLIRNW